MNVFQITILSLLEGVTEFLPVSSTAHLMLASEVLGIARTETHKSFEIAIQLGAILAVVVLYGRTLLLDRRAVLRTITAFIPTAVIGFLLHGIVKSVFLESLPLVLVMLFAGGVILIVFEWMMRGTSVTVRGIGDISPVQAVIIGLCQSIAIIPGVSRAAATIIGGQLLGISRRTIVEFSFVLAIPTMAAATGYDLWKTAGEFTSADLQNLTVGFVLSFIFALVAIKWFLEFVKTHSFAVFGMYRIILAVLFWIFLLRS